MRLFLSRLMDHAKREVAKHAGLVAASLPDFPFDAFSEAQATQWWAEAADEELLPTLEEVWRQAYLREANVVTGLDTVPSYLAQVRDRLVPGTGAMLSPSIPEDAFNMARGVINRAIATGDSAETLAKDLAATFRWDHDSSYWRKRKELADAEIDAILDPIGPPGDPAREAARLNDPRVIAMRQDRNLAQARLDSSKSTWQNRATRIARTEATGALNAGTLAAMRAEGVSCIEWVSTSDARTRPSHARMDGQITVLGTPFSNGLRMPGDPTGPASQVVNCRCTIVAAACPPELAPLAPQTPTLTLVPGIAEVAPALASAALKQSPYALEKWVGKKQPKKPAGKPEPPVAQTHADKAWSEWLDKVRADYLAFLDANPQFPKKQLEQSNNWGQFQKLMSAQPTVAEQALVFLMDNKYLSNELADLANTNLKLARSAKGAELILDAEQEARYRREIKNWKHRDLVYRKKLAAWREANGITTPEISLRGMVDGTPRVFTSGYDGTGWVSQKLPDPKGKGREALQYYTGSGYTPMNNALRQSNGAVPSGDLGQKIAAADSGMAGMPEDAIVHRGAGWPDVVFPNGTRGGYSVPPPNPTDLIGTVQVQHGYTSTSIAERAAFSSNPVQWVIRVPEGHPVAHLSNISSYRSENELLLSRGTHFYVHDVYQFNGKWIIEAEVLPSEIDLDELHLNTDFLSPAPRGAQLGWVTKGM